MNQILSFENYRINDGSKTESNPETNLDLKKRPNQIKNRILTYKTGEPNHELNLQCFMLFNIYYSNPSYIYCTMQMPRQIPR